MAAQRQSFNTENGKICRTIHYFEEVEFYTL